MTSLLFITIISLSLATSAYSQFWSSPTPLALQPTGKFQTILKKKEKKFLFSSAQVSYGIICKCMWMHGGVQEDDLYEGPAPACVTRGSLYQ